MRKSVRSRLVELVKQSNGKISVKELLEKLRTEFPNVKYLTLPDRQALYDAIFPIRHMFTRVREDGEEFLVLQPSPTPTPSTTPKSKKSVKGK